MLKIVLCLVFSLLVLTVSCSPTPDPFEPVTKTATKVEIINISDEAFVIPCPVVPKESTCKYFLYYELHKNELIKNTKLTCDDNTPGGTHPTPALACEEILKIEGDVSKLEPKPCYCTTEIDPVIVNIQGKFKGQPFKLLQTFDNPCLFKCATQPITHFVSIGLGM